MEQQEIIRTPIDETRFREESSRVKTLDEEVQILESLISKRDSFNDVIAMTQATIEERQSFLDAQLAKQANLDEPISQQQAIVDDLRSKGMKTQKEIEAEPAVEPTNEPVEPS